MLAGALYDASDATLTEDRVRASRLCRAPTALDPADRAARSALLAELFRPRPTLTSRLPSIATTATTSCSAATFMST